MEGPPKKQGTFHVLKCNYLKVSHLQNGPWKVSPHGLERRLPWASVLSYNPQSEALKVFLGALGTLGKKVKPVSLSRSAMDMSSLAASLPFRRHRTSAKLPLVQRKLYPVSTFRTWLSWSKDSGPMDIP